MRLLKPSLPFQFKEMQFALKIDSIPSFPALTQRDVDRIWWKAQGGWVWSEAGHWQSSQRVRARQVILSTGGAQSEGFWFVCSSAVF